MASVMSAPARGAGRGERPTFDAAPTAPVNGSVDSKSSFTLEKDPARDVGWERLRLAYAGSGSTSPARCYACSLVAGHILLGDPREVPR